ncbi:MAG: ferrous iron transporter B [Deltaproteobacteria bacterium]|nr:ferrous iron transporter B [Deltaproteobacteria bacterium]
MSTTAATAPLRLGLVGSPNSGKTTLFNALTGLRAKVGNYPGVTVECREGSANFDGRRSVVIDLPGTYSLSPISPDEEVVVRVLDGELSDAPEALVVVADTCTLERSLLMLAQILRREMPTCLVLTMTDEFQRRGGQIDIPRLERALGIPVLPVVGHRGIGIAELRRLLAKPEDWSRPHLMPPEEIHARAGWVESILENVLTRRPGSSRKSDTADRIVLHPVFGPLLFAGVMVTFFQLIFAWARPAMDFIDAGVALLGKTVHAQLPAGLFADFLADGLIAGVGSVIIFLPQILLLFTLLYFLGDIGYMARAAFVIDRVMAKVGLEGRAFVSLLSSYACAVPGIMATRTIPSPRHRLVTILVAPLMTCSARLPVYALLIGAFVPAVRVAGPFGLQGLVLLGLYLAGSLTALLVASVLTRTLLREDAMPFYMELPPYRMPTARLLASQVGRSAWAFLRRAGTIILAVSIVLWCLLTFPRQPAPAGASPAEASRYALEHSFAGRAGHAIEPLIKPLGFDWKIGIGLIASLAAREVIVSTLAQIYAASDQDTSLRASIQNDIDPRTGEKTFDPPTVASLLVFFVFALQCMSTLAIMRRETNSWRWPAFAFSYLLALAYGASFATHRIVESLLH